MDNSFVWITRSNKRIPSLADIAALQFLADQNGFISRFGVYMAAQIASHGMRLSLEDLAEKGLITEQKKEGDPYPRIGITAKGRRILELCDKTSMVFREVEASFEEVGW